MVADAISISPDECGICKSINEIRMAANMTPLAFDDRLSLLSKERSKDMADNNYFSHYDENRKPYFYTMITASCDNPDIGGYGENLERDDYSPAVSEVVDAWMASEKHKENILDPRWRSIGVGRAVNKLGKFFFTTLFSDQPCEAPHQFKEIVTGS